MKGESTVSPTSQYFDTRSYERRNQPRTEEEERKGVQRFIACKGQKFILMPEEAVEAIGGVETLRAQLWSWERLVTRLFQSAMLSKTHPRLLSLFWV